MRIAPTLEGGLRIDPETPDDWLILHAILLDANGAEPDLAEQLGGMVTHERLAEDWQDIVVPDLRESFSDSLYHIQAVIDTAAALPKDSVCPIWITREESLNWYSALNQARLALEKKYGLGSYSESDPANISPIRHEALIRSQFYCALQSLLLRHSL